MFRPSGGHRQVVHSEVELIYIYIYIYMYICDEYDDYNDLNFENVLLVYF